ncbi:MAG: DUF559 domain-containing protein [bacterium]|nr:DUF559 domain-containing protein [bacterium]
MWTLVCLDKKLIIELDGGQHLGDENDRVRDSWLKEEGCIVLRYWNNQALNETEDVIEDIMRNADSPSP